MKWVWISLGIALITAITVNCCFLVYRGFKVDCVMSVVWVLTIILAVDLIACLCFACRKLKAEIQKRIAEQKAKDCEEWKGACVSEVMKEILGLREELRKANEKINKIEEENRNISKS